MEKLKELSNTLDQLYADMKKALAEYVKENGGIIIFPNGDDDKTLPYVILTEYGRAGCPDTYYEGRALALKYNADEDDVMFYGVQEFANVKVRYTPEDIINDTSGEFWYYLDWDCSNAFQYNIERIFFYLTSDEYGEKTL